MMMPDFGDVEKLKQQLNDLNKVQDIVSQLESGWDFSRNEDDIVLKLFDNEKGFGFSYGKIWSILKQFAKAYKLKDVEIEDIKENLQKWENEYYERTGKKFEEN